jgi:hypothetical protein
MVTDDVKNRMPIDDFKKLGLMNNDTLNLTKDDLKELSAGRKSGLLDLKNLEHEGIQIERLKAKVSLQENKDGSLSVLVHPIYKNPQKHSLLNDKEMDSLITGEKASIVKSYIDEKGKNHKMLIEYDKDTKEFVSMNTNRILVPEKINNEPLTPAQKAKYKEGEAVTMPDGTMLQPSPTAKNGVRSNNTFLILSILIDGGVSYLLVKAAQALLGNDRNNDPARAQSAQINNAFEKGYLEAVKEMEAQKWNNRNSKLMNFPDDHHKLDLDELKLKGQNNNKQESRSYTRGGISR